MLKSFSATMVLLGMSLQAQQPTLELMNNVTNIESRYGKGAAFAVGVEGREYWITAKHMVNGKKHPPYGVAGVTSVVLKLQNRVTGSWTRVNFKVLETGKDIDIVVLVATNPLVKTIGDLAPAMAHAPLNLPRASSVGIQLGQHCGFVGYPFPAWPATVQNGKFLFPYAKSCVLAAEDEAHSLWWLDGHNNPGFSGGPVYFGNGPDLKIAAVVSGYQPEGAEVTRLSESPSDHHITEEETNYLAHVNSGFFLAYDITKALLAIQRHPIGPIQAASK
jgi:hypothetical protein